MVTGRVSVVIVTHNSLSVIRDCLIALSRTSARLDHEVVVVDNASRDGTLVAVAEAAPHAKCFVNERNLGFARACNRGAAQAEGEYLLFLNPDVVLDEGATEALMATIRSDARAGAVGGRLRFPDGRFQATCRRLPTIGNMLLSRGSVVGKLIGGFQYTLPDFADTTEVPALAATMLMMRSSLFRRLSGFDERFFMYMEDTDLCCRLQRSGCNNYFVPFAGGVHAWGAGSDAGRVRRLWYHHNSVWKYFMKHLPSGFSMFVLPVVLTVNFVLAVVLDLLGLGRRR